MLKFLVSFIKPSVDEENSIKLVEIKQRKTLSANHGYIKFVSFIQTVFPHFKCQNTYLTTCEGVFQLR